MSLIELLKWKRNGSASSYPSLTIPRALLLAGTPISPLVAAATTLGPHSRIVDVGGEEGGGDGHTQPSP